MAGNVACVRQKVSAHKFGVGNLEQRDDLADLAVDGGIILNTYSVLW